MAEVGSAFVSILPSARGFGNKLDGEIGGELDGAGKRGGSRFGGAFKVGALAALGGAAVLTGFLKGSLDEAREAQKVGATTFQIIKQTGFAAGVSAEHVGKYAAALSAKTGVDDEAIQSGSNLILTFKNVANAGDGVNAIFDRATKASVDLSAAGFGSIEGASLQLGKALNDPLKGISALGRAGVTFTDQQKAQIKTLVESGDILGAQKIILAEVESQVGGVAEASATYGEKAGVAFGNIKEQVGTALLPAVDGFFKLFLKSVPTVTRLIDGIGPAFGKIGDFLGPAKDAIEGVFSSFSGGGAGGLLTTFKDIGSSIASNFLPVLQTMATTFTTVVLPAILRVGSYLAANLLPVFQRVAGIVTANVLPILARLATFFYGTLYPAVLAIVTAVASRLKPVFDQLFVTIQNTVLPVVESLLAKFREWQPTLEKVAVIVLKVVGFVLMLAAAILGRVLPPLIRFAAFLLTNVIGAIAGVIGIVIKIIGALIRFGATVIEGGRQIGQLAVTVKNKIGEAIGFVQDIPDKAKKALGDLGSKLKGAGRELIQGLIDGILDKLKDLGAAMGKVGDKIKGFLPGSPVKVGPLKSWNNGGAGKRLIGMLAEGLSDTTPLDAAMGRLSGRIAIAAPRVDLTSVGGSGSTGGLRPIIVNDRSGSPAQTARDVARYEAFAGVA